MQRAPAAQLDEMQQCCARSQTRHAVHDRLCFAMLSLAISQAYSQVACAAEDDAYSSQAAPSACSTPTFSLDAQPEFSGIFEDEPALDPAGERPCQAQSVPLVAPLACTIGHHSSTAADALEVSHMCRQLAAVGSLTCWSEVTSESCTDIGSRQHVLEM